MKPAPPPTIAFDPLRRARSASLKADIADLARDLAAHESATSPRTRKRKPEDAAKFLLAVEVVVCNALAHILTGALDPIAVPRNNSALYPPPRYRHPAYGKHFLTVLGLMADPAFGLLEDLGRGYRVSATIRKASTIRATARLHSQLSPVAKGEGWDALGREEPPEVLILRADRDAETGKVAPVAYRDTANTKRMRRELLDLNTHLVAAPIAILPAAPGDSPVDPTQRSLRRIFNNRSWQAGGRLFGGFWETMPKAERFRRIRIGGEPVASADYGQLFVWLLYAQAGLEPPPGDLYDFEIGGAAERPAWKVIVNAMLFADGELVRWPRDALGVFPEGTKLRDLTARVKERHAAVAGLFGSAVGLKLMHIESCLMIGALGRLAVQGIVGLPVHDAVLVPVSATGLAVQAMQDSAAAMNYPRAKLSVEGNGIKSLKQ